jgi:multidrug efflux pump subunit AcrA (membrane-fusion protein)
MTQTDPDRDLLAEIERLEPLAKAEQLAGGRENPWRGKTEELKAARTRLDAARVAREAEAQAQEVRNYQILLGRRGAVSAKLAEFDAQLAALGETTRDYFAQANAIMRWLGFGLRRDPRTGEELIEPLSPYTCRGLWGNVIDEPPIGCDKRPVVPAEEWEAVKQYRYLYCQRQGVAGELDSISRDLRYMVAKTPALSFVKARQPVTA